MVPIAYLIETAFCARSSAACCSTDVRRSQDRRTKEAARLTITSLACG